MEGIQYNCQPSSLPTHPLTDLSKKSVKNQWKVIVRNHKFLGHWNFLKRTHRFSLSCLFYTCFVHSNAQ